MANELRVRQDFVAGALSAPLSAAGTSMSSAGLEDMQVIDTSNFCSVGLFRTDASGRVIQKEIVWVVVHTAGATTATVVRGREGTTAQDWDTGDRWSHSQTARDITVICLSTARPTNPHRGLEIYEIDTGAKRVWDGIAWQSASGIPVGTIIFKTKDTTPAGFLRTDGSLYDRDVYSALFAEIGFDYSPTPGQDPGSNQFYVPNTQGRVFVDRDATQTEFDTVGEKGGSKTSTAPHTHSLSAHTHTMQNHTHSFSHTHSTDVISTNHAHNVYARNQNTGGQSDNHSHQGRTTTWGGDASAGAQGYPVNDAHAGFRTTDRTGQLLWAGTIGGVCRIDNNSVYQDHTHNFNHDHPSTNYQNESPWAGNWQHEHTTDSQSTSMTGAPSNNTSAAPSNDTSGASSAAATSGNLQPYMVLVGFIKF